MKLVETQPCSFAYILFVAAFVAPEQSSAAETETTWPTKPRVLIIWHFTGKVCHPMV